MIRRRTPLSRADDRSWLWALVGSLLLVFGGGMLLDWGTALDFAAAFYRQATFPFSLLPLPWLGVWLLTGAGAVAVSSDARHVSERAAFWLRIYALWVLAIVGWWYAAAGFVFGAATIVIIVGWTLAGYRYQPRDVASWKD
jgi:hypothetical protein